MQVSRSPRTSYAQTGSRRKTHRYRLSGGPRDRLGSDGLSSSPNDVAVTGTIDSFNRCFPPPEGCHALVNFWRSLSNLTIDVNTAAKKGCEAAGEFWATSQAAPMRRVHVNGFTTLMHFCPP